MQLASGTTIRHAPRTPAVTPVQVAQGPVGPAGGSDASFAAFVNDPASATRAGLSATIAAQAAPRKQTYDITRYGAKPGTYISDAAMTAGSAQLSSPSHSFTSADVGKTVGVRGAGVVSTDFLTIANDGVLVATITSVSGGVATLSQSATTTVSGAPCAFGELIDSALAQAIADATAAGGGTVFFPTGVWVASAAQPFGSRISFAGAGRGNTFVYVTKVGTAANLNTTPWIRASGLSIPDRYAEVNLSDFTVDGSFYAATDAYTADLKMIHVARTADSTVERIASVNNPATALGYDESVNCLIANNIITNPGRLAAPGSTSGSPGGSGIGVAVGGLSDLSMVIRGNYVKGLWTTTGGVGRSGINIEAASGTTIPTTYQAGIHIADNFVEGFFNGVVDSGGVGTIIGGNTVRRCTNGIKTGTNGITNGSAARADIIAGNVVENSITAVVGGNTYSAVGIMTTSSGAAKDTRGRTLIQGNVVRSSAAYGIRVVGGTFPIEHVRVVNNQVLDSGTFGIQVAGGTVNECYVIGNTVVGSGQTGANGDAIDVQSGTVWTGGRIENNDLSDLQAVPTQTNRVDTGGATLSGVTIKGNTGDPASTTDSTARKTSTTTINGNSNFATLSAFSLALVTAATYELTALIEYSSSAAAGVKFQWALPAGASVNWRIDGPGAPTAMLSATGTATLTGAGVGVSQVALVKGFIVTTTTAGNLTLQAAQNTPDATDTVITTKTQMSLRKVA